MKNRLLGAALSLVLVAAATARAADLTMGPRLEYPHAIDGHEGRKDPATWVARVAENGTRVEGVRKVGDDTCVCCREDTAAGTGGTVALAWRRVFAGDVRDMVLALSRDGGRTFGDATLVSADNWNINACPHRGGAVGLDARGRVYMSWYTEGTDIRPDLRFAVSPDGTFLVAWHEEQFPHLKTVVQPVRIPKAR
jgi:hypothetical protein